MKTRRLQRIAVLLCAAGMVHATLLCIDVNAMVVGLVNSATPALVRMIVMATGCAWLAVAFATWSSMASAVNTSVAQAIARAMAIALMANASAALATLEMLVIRLRMAWG